MSNETYTMLLVLLFLVERRKKHVDFVVVVEICLLFLRLQFCWFVFVCFLAVFVRMIRIGVFDLYVGTREGEKDDELDGELVVEVDNIFLSSMKQPPVIV